MKKKILSLLLTLVMMVSLLPNALAAKPATFKDVKEDMWCFDYVEYVAEKGYFNGTTATTFSPNGTMTRQQFVTVLARMAGVKVDNSKSAFSDVPAGSYSAGSVTWAAKEGIATGYADGTFKPTAPVTRQQMCAFMSRFMDYYAEAYGVYFLKKAKVSSFADYNQVADYAKDAVDRCRAYGLIQGYAEDNTFRPAATATRAHVAAVIFRLDQIIQRAAGGGPGGFIPTPTTTYTLNYTSSILNKSLSVPQVNNGTFTLKAITDLYTAAEYNAITDKVFLNWMDGDVSYPVPGTIDLAALGVTSKTLTANWADKNDLLLNAMTKASDYFTHTILEDQQLKDVEAELERYVTLSDMSMVTKAEGTNREVILSADVNLTADLYGDLVKTAFYYAYDLLEMSYGRSESDIDVVSEEELKEIVKNILDILNITGADENDLWDMAEKLADQLHDELIAIGDRKGYGDKLWEGFEPTETGNQPIIDSVTVKDGSQVLTVYSKDKTYAYGNGQPMTEKKALERVAEAAAESLYESLKEHDDKFYYDLELEATLDLVFDLSAEAEPIASAYPVNYKAIARMNLNQDDENKNELLGYRFAPNEGVAGKHYIQLVISPLMQTEYTALMEKSVIKALDEVKNDAKLKDDVADVVVDKILDEVKGDKFENYVKDNAALRNAVDAWIDANVDTGASASDASFVLLYDYLWNQEGQVTADGKTTDGKTLLDNTHLDAYIKNVAVTYLFDEFDDDVNGQYELDEAVPTIMDNDLQDFMELLLETVIAEEATVAEIETAGGKLISLMNRLLTADYVTPEEKADLREPIEDEAEEGIVNLMKNQTDLFKIIQEMPNSAVAEGKVENINFEKGFWKYLRDKALNVAGLVDAYPIDDTQNGAEDLILEDLITAALDFYDADMNTITAEMLTKQDGKYNYVDYINNVAKIKDLKKFTEEVDVKIAELCDLLTNEDVLDALKGEKAPGFVSDVAWAVKELEDLMKDGDVKNVYIDGVELKLSEVTALRVVLKDKNAEADDICKAVAKFLKPFGELKLSDFTTTGVEFKGNFKYEDYSFDPEINFSIKFN